MFKKNRDRIFQLSLTEVAFILVFLLMLLLSKMLSNEKSARADVQDRLNEALIIIDRYKDAENIEFLQKRYKDLEDLIKKFLLQKSILDADKLLDDLVSISKLDKEIADLKKELAEAKGQAQICNALIENNSGINGIELKKLLQKNQDVDKALALLQGKGINLTSANDLVGQFIRNVKEVELLRKKCGGGGIGACWLDESGKTQNLLDIRLEAEYMAVSIPNLPANRLADLYKLPGISDATRKIIPYSEIHTSFNPILQWSKSQTPECRHYVAIKSNIPYTKDSTPKRLKIQQYFYPDESVK